MINPLVLKDKNNALLVLRIGIGIMFLFHGVPKIWGGYDTWVWLGGRMELIGINFWPAFWGFLASLAEALGGLLLILGLFTRYTAIVMAFTMLIAVLHKFSTGDGFAGASHAIELGILFIFLAMMGPGTLSLDKSLFNRT